MPRKKNPFAVPKKRGPQSRLQSKVDRTVVLEQKHIEMIADYRANHPTLDSDSAVVRLAIERLCTPVDIVESGTAEKEEADRDVYVQPDNEEVGQEAKDRTDANAQGTHEVDDG